MRRVITITPQVVERVKELLPVEPSLHSISRKVGIAFSSVRNIKLGKYDTNEPLDKKKVEPEGYFKVHKYENWLV